MAQIPIGTVGEYKTRVTSDITIGFMGVDGARVLSTPEMIRLMEHACRDAVLPLLDSGHDTVGTHVNVFHGAAAPMASQVTVRAEVLETTDRRIQFRVEAAIEKETIGEGTHERTIVNVAKFAAKQADKGG